MPGQAGVGTVSPPCHLPPRVHGRGVSAAQWLQDFPDATQSLGLDRGRHMGDRPAKQQLKGCGRQSQAGRWAQANSRLCGHQIFQPHHRSIHSASRGHSRDARRGPSSDTVIRPRCTAPQACFPGVQLHHSPRGSWPKELGEGERWPWTPTGINLQVLKAQGLHLIYLLLPFSSAVQIKWTPTNQREAI